mgnify:CR=1 FL=1
MGLIGHLSKLKTMNVVIRPNHLSILSQGTLLTLIIKFLTQERTLLQKLILIRSMQTQNSMDTPIRWILTLRVHPIPSNPYLQLKFSLLIKSLRVSSFISTQGPNIQSMGKDTILRCTQFITQQNKETGSLLRQWE